MYICDTEILYPQRQECISALVLLFLVLFSVLFTFSISLMMIKA